MSDHARIILKVWLGLLALLTLTTAMAFAPVGRATLGISLAIAIAKVLLVMLFFMELRASAGLVRAAAVAGFAWLLILFTLAGADFVTRVDVHAPLEVSSPNGGS